MDVCHRWRSKLVLLAAVEAVTCRVIRPFASQTLGGGRKCDWIFIKKSTVSVTYPSCRSCEKANNQANGLPLCNSPSTRCRAPLSGGIAHFSLRMRLLCVLLVAIVLLSACSHATAVTSDSTTTMNVGAGTSLDGQPRYSQTRRNLRTHKSSRGHEERAFEIFSKLLSKTPKNAEEVFELFTKMKVSGEQSKLFENPLFLKWTNAVRKGYKANSDAAEMAIAAALAREHGDDGLAKIIAEAKTVSSTETVAVNLEKAQIENWLAADKSVDDVFRALKLEKNNYVSLWDPLVSTWIKYADATKAKTYELLLAKLRVHQSDGKIAGYIGTLKQEAVPNPIADNLEKVLIESWIPQSADDVFKLLQLDTRGNELFHSPRLGTWVNYVIKQEGKQADEQMYKVLKATYGDDELTNLLAGSKKYLNGDVAKRVEDVEHQIYLSGGKTAKEMFSSLKLDTQGDKLFESQALGSWVDYVTKLNPEKADEVILSTLKTTYSDDALGKMFVAAKESAETKDIAGKLEKAQLADWLRNEQSADAVFKLLKLDDDVDKVLTNPLLNTWLVYVKRLNDNPYTILLGKLKTSKLTNTDKKLVEMLKEAKKEASTSAIAGNLEAAQLQKLLKEEKTAADVFKLLEMDKQVYLFLGHSEVRAWVAYVTMLDPRKADDVVLSVLKPYFTDSKLASIVSIARGEADDMAKTFERILLKKWLSEKKSAGDVFDFVLQGRRESVFQGHDWNLWATYVKTVEKDEPYQAMWMVLQKRLNDEQLDAMFYRASENSGAAAIADKLWVEKRLSEATSVRDAFVKLRLNQAETALFEKPELMRWISYVTKLDPEKADETVLSVLQTFYVEKQLVPMLEAAKQVEETKGIAARLERLLALSKKKVS